MRHHVFTIALLACSALTLGSCRHKDLWYEENSRMDVYVVFDWRNAPDAQPESMMAYFYPADGSQELTYTFADREGGHASVPAGTYCGIGLNGDTSYRLGIRNTETPDGFEVYTKDAHELEGYGLQARSLPRAEESAEERMALTPDMVWSDRQDNIELPDDFEGTRYITFYPEEIVCHYTVDILDVENIDNLHGASVDATLSGMAEGYLHGKRSTTDVAVTMPFTLKPETAERSMHAEFLTFGECDTNKVRHMLTVYMYLTDGSKWYKTIDVSDQVSTAPDPRHVHIVVRGLELPKIISGSGGFIPDVDEWRDISIDLPM
ncbi:MAG: DUF5119 domain-containing protein [Muribaculaceae bacterium]|nr:DUF5119 domain-containing protein [Muribaculaceae bacterium]